MFTEQPTE